METREIVGDSEKQIAKEWFEELRDMICKDFEKIESTTFCDDLVTYMASIKKLVLHFDSKILEVI